MSLSPFATPAPSLTAAADMGMANSTTAMSMMTAFSTEYVARAPPPRPI